jgi:3',5'-cyclic AMP phosphodiesterase CpdA
MPYRRDDQAEDPMTVRFRLRARPPVLTVVAAVIALLSCTNPATLARGDQQQAGAAVVAGSTPAAPTEFPNHADSLKFIAFGDFGTGEPDQYALAKQMAAFHGRFKFELAVLLGDNLYGSERPQDFVRKFEEPYRPLIDAGVKFKASLGNHDAREMRNYKYFDMQDKLFYSFKAPKQSVRFYAFESTYMTPEQLSWIENELKTTGDDWKIPFFHHPLYSSARAHGSTLALRESLEPLFIRYNVSIVLSGHDHVYERTKPQNGIVYFVVGSGGKLRSGDLQPGSPLTARGFDADLAFFAGEIEGDNLVFQVISRVGRVVDSGIIIRRKPASQRQLPLAALAAFWALRSPSPLQTAAGSRGQSANR